MNKNYTHSNSFFFRTTAILTLLFTLVSVIVPSYATVIDLTPALTGNASEILYEDISKRDEYSRHYVTGDGSYLAVSYAEQVNYQDEDGEWVAVDNSFSNKLTGTLENGNERFKLKFSKHADGNKLVSIKTDDYKVSWNLAFSYDGENYVAPEKSVGVGSGYSDVPTSTADATSFGNAVGTVEYSAVLPSVDLKYTVSHGKIKEDIILLENTGLLSYIAEYKVENGVTAVAADDGSVGFYRDGDLLYYLASPYMYDAAGEVCYGITVEVTQNKKTVNVKYVLDTEWLSESERVYPVVIDPSVSSSQSWGNIQSAYFNEGDYQVLGYIEDNHYNQSPIWVDDNQNVAYVEIFEVPERPVFSTVLGASLILHAEEDTFSVLDGTPISFYAQTVAVEWDGEIGYSGNIPMLTGESFSAREEQGSNPLRVEFALPVYDSNYESYFTNSHGFKLSAINLNAYFYGTGTYAPTILVRYELSSDTGETGIVSGSTYFLKNTESDQYLSVSDYLDDDGNNVKNVFQRTAGVNDQYSRGVKINYFTTLGEYRLLSALSDYDNNQYIYPDSSGNVTYGEGSTAASNSYWNIRAVSGGVVIFKVVNGVYKALTADDSLDGNIILSDYTEGEAKQIWTLTQTTVNHHIINRSVTKKNIGAGEEWVFRLSASEMNSSSFTVNGYSISREGFAQIRRNGKSLIVHVLDDDGTSDNKVDNFAIITLSVTENKSDGTVINEERVVVIQNSGTTNGGGCTTVPFEAESTLRTITLNEGETAEYILTFKSSLGNVQISEWEIFSNYGGIKFDDAAGKEMIGSNFAIIELLRDDIAVINAYKSNGECYTLVVECKCDNSSNEYYKTLKSEDTIYSNINNVISLYNNSIYYVALDIDQNIEKSVGLVEITDCWDTIAKVIVYDKYYCIVQTYNLLADISLNIDLVYPSGSEASGMEFYLSIIKSPNPSYFEGAYYIRNRDSELYVDIDSNSNQMSEGAFTEASEFKGSASQRWIFKYLENEYYHITSELSGLALMVAYGKETDEDYGIIQGVCNPISHNQQWKIEQTPNGSYKFINRATEEQGKNFVMCMGGSLGDIIQETTIENRLYKDNDSFWDEWEIVKKRGYKVVNYIDLGFITERGYGSFEEAKSDIERSYSVVSYVLSELFGIDLILYYEDATGYLEQEIETHLLNCRGKNCANSDYHLRNNMREDFRAYVGDNSYEDIRDVTFVLWSNYHFVSGENNKNRSCSYYDCVFMLDIKDSVLPNEKDWRNNWKKITRVLLHELSHQFSAPDHYCEMIVSGKDENGNNTISCKNAQYCENLNHTHDNKAPRWNGCVMDNSIENYNGGTFENSNKVWEDVIQCELYDIYCEECYWEIATYIWREN